MAPFDPRPKQEIRIEPFGTSTSLPHLLELIPPPFSREDPFHQLDYIADYVRKLGCQSILLESHYVDRDYIEDHALFYSRSFFHYLNSCTRLHFFSLPDDRLRQELAVLQDLCATAAVTDRAARWAQFSSTAYLGFSVIKPLAGSPVGRTILRSFESSTSDGDVREYGAVRRYTVHLGAVELEVIGLPFQQQDVGVSACATTALWSALHKLRAFEEIGSPTPAQITTLATAYSLPFGRPMPSDEGLSLDQMCQALQALKVAPSLFFVPEELFAREYIFATLRSGFSPVLLLESMTEKNTWHAVAAVGFRRGPTPGLQPGEVYDLSGDLKALYVHDDRIGPYQRVDLISTGQSLQLKSRYTRDSQDWLLKYVLIPLHAKIRVPISGLFEVALDIITKVRSADPAGDNTQLSLSFETWISRPPNYFQDLYAVRHPSGPSLAQLLIDKLSLPRYIGIVRLNGPSIGTIDVLIDTTSTMKNLNFLAITHHGSASDRRSLNALASGYHAEVFTSV